MSAQVETPQAVTKDDAKAHAERVRGFINSISEHVTVWGDAIIKAYTEEHWRALEYDSWEAYCHGEFNDALTRLNRVLVIDTAIKLGTEGHMSLRAIEVATGISKSSVARALTEIEKIPAIEGVPDGTPASTKSKGRDGKSYSKPKPKTDQPQALTEATVLALTEATVLHLIEENPKGITRTAICNATGARMRDLNPILEDLADEKKIHGIAPGNAPTAFTMYPGPLPAEFEDEPKPAETESGPSDADRGKGKIDQCAQWAFGYLSENGPQTAYNMVTAAGKKGFAPPTLTRAVNKDDRLAFMQYYLHSRYELSREDEQSAPYRNADLADCARLMISLFGAEKAKAVAQAVISSAAPR